ncbi:uncharacterized protein TNCV_4552851 [Trichonephila clavipes]|nr:uncharacterized protein TNCV_4552851 [Trichonephila clavipes]
MSWLLYQLVYNPASLVVPGGVWMGSCIAEGGLSRGHYWLLNLWLALPNWSSENQKGFFSSFLKKTFKINQNNEKNQNAFIKTPNPPYPTHDARPMDSLNSCPGGELKSEKRLRSGDLLVETNSALQIKSFLLAKSFLNSPITINPHKILNSCRGIISETDLLSTPEEEILEGFSNQSVIQRFGHSQTSFRGQLTCSRCASLGYASTDCSLELKCINCLQPHPSDSKICPEWKIDEQIQEIKTNKNISYPESRKLIVPQLSQTYAQAAKSSTLNNSTQTDENITKIKCPPLKLLAQLLSKQRPNIPTAVTTSSSAQAQILPSISSKTSTISNPQPPTPMSETKGKIKEQPSPVHRPRKDSKKNRLNECKTYNKFKEKSCKKHICKDCERRRFTL